MKRLTYRNTKNYNYVQHKYKEPCMVVLRLYQSARAVAQGSSIQTGDPVHSH